jgi:hypothetical protein
MQQDPTIIDDYLADDNQPKVLSDIEVFTKIWLQPKRVFNYIKEFKYKKFVVLLYMFSGTIYFINKGTTGLWTTKIPFWQTIIICIVAGSILMGLTFYIYALVLTFTGKWFKGKGNVKSMFRTLAYAKIPQLCLIPFISIQLALYGSDFFTGNYYYSNMFERIVNYILYYGSIVFNLWSFILAIVSISVIHEFSIGKAILSWFVAIVLIALPITVVAMAKLYL